MFVITENIINALYSNAARIIIIIISSSSSSSSRSSSSSIDGNTISNIAVAM